MLNIVSISKTFSSPSASGPIKALNDVSFRVASGEILGLIGPSGAGKSTALRSLNLLEKPDSGSIFLENEDLLKKTPAELRLLRQKVAMIFQHFNLLSNLTVWDNVAFPLRIAGWTKNDINARVNEVLTIVGLPDKRTSFPAQLSGGQKQRVAIARSIANHPKILLADEPTSALDPLTKMDVLNCLQHLNKTLGLTVVIATHEIGIVKRICHRALLFKDHQIHEEILVKNGEVTPQTPFGRLFLEASQ